MGWKLRFVGPEREQGPLRPDLVYAFNRESTSIPPWTAAVRHEAVASDQHRIAGFDHLDRHVSKVSAQVRHGLLPVVPSRAAAVTEDSFHENIAPAVILKTEADEGVSAITGVTLDAKGDLFKHGLPRLRGLAL